jgi:AcrR family transcriptional regulator
MRGVAPGTIPAMPERSFTKSRRPGCARAPASSARPAAARPAAAKPSGAPTPRARASPRRPAERGRGRPPIPELRERILAAAEALFSTRGFHGTGLRDIAERAGVAVGNVYTHFPTKEALFEALMGDLERRYIAPDQPIPRALAAMTDFPDGLERLGAAAKEQVRRFAGYIRLIYVDVIEFEGKHLRNLYGNMRARYEEIFERRFAQGKRSGRLSEVDPYVAVMMATIAYMHYFTVEHLFGVRAHYGLLDEQVVHEIARIITYGALTRKRRRT